MYELLTVYIESELCLSFTSLRACKGRLVDNKIFEKSLYEFLFVCLFLFNEHYASIHQHFLQFTMLIINNGSFLWGVTLFITVIEYF